MATKRIIDLNEKVTVSDSDVLLVESPDNTNKVTKENLLKDRVKYEEYEQKIKELESRLEALENK